VYFGDPEDLIPDDIPGIVRYRVFHAPTFSFSFSSRRQMERLREQASAFINSHVGVDNVISIAEHTGSLWQILFMDKTPRNQADILASDQVSMRKLDTLLMKRGQYVLPGVRRFVSTAHTGQDLEETLRGLDAACREFNQC